MTLLEMSPLYAQSASALHQRITQLRAAERAQTDPLEARRIHSRIVCLQPLLREMRKNPRVIGVKNSSMPIQDIQMFRDEAGEECIIFNGPDEQLAGGLMVGAEGGIGGTYGVMPEVYMAIYDAVMRGNRKKAMELQNKANRIIYALCGCPRGSMLAAIKEVIRLREGITLGGVRAPMASLEPEDMEQIHLCVKLIDELVAEGGLG